MKLTPHFSLEEFSYSSTALSRGIDNSVPNEYIKSLINLCKHCLEPLRDAVKEPVIISSGYRCQTLNNIVGGSKNSQHMKGEAADIYIEDNLKLRQWFEILKQKADYDQLILERASKKSSHYWIHVSCKPNIISNRHQVIYMTKN